MIWWRGRGLWIPLIVALPILSASNIDNGYVGSLAFLAAALFVFALRDWLGEDSAIYSIRTKYWPPLLVVLAILSCFETMVRGGTFDKVAREDALVTAAPASVVVAPSAQDVVPAARGRPAFESWARAALGASDFRYVSDSEVWISTMQAADEPERLAKLGAAQYRALVSSAKSVEVVIFINNARAAEATE